MLDLTSRSSGAAEPELTPEREQEVRFIQKSGYLVVDDAITPEEVEIPARRHARRRFARHRGVAPGVQPGAYGSFFRELLEKDRSAFLLDNPPVLTLMTVTLRNAVQLHSASGRVIPRVRRS